MKHIISLGAGVQSSVMALMAAHGEIEPMPDAAVFADTQAEPQSVYDWLDWLEGQLPFPVLRATKGNLEEDSIACRVSQKSGRRYVQSFVPYWLKAEDGSRGSTIRKCTRDYKINVIRSTIKRQVCHLPAGGRLPSEAVATSWIGISRDEAHRMKPSNEAWVENRWPLIEQGMDRNDCKRWMERNGYPEPPRSACVFCPYRSDAEWIRMKRDEPDAFQRAVDFEERLRGAMESHDEVTRGQVFLWQGLEPLARADFNENSSQLDLFGNECEGMCGV